MRIERLRNLLFPPKCMICGKILREDEGICAACRSGVFLNGALPRYGRKGEYDAVIAGLWYEGAVRRAILGLKYHEKQSYARPLGKIMLYAVREKLKEPFDLITFVPTNPGTERSRGYNQAQLLAEELSRLSGKPCLAALRKTRATKAMHGLTPSQRRENVKDAYELCCEKSRIDGMRILLADDILTTGATIAACSAVLKKQGAKAVYGVCAAAAHKYERNL